MTCPCAAPSKLAWVALAVVCCLSVLTPTLGAAGDTAALAEAVAKAARAAAAANASDMPLQLTDDSLEDVLDGSRTVIAAFLIGPRPRFEGELVRLHKILSAESPDAVVAAGAASKDMIGRFGLVNFPSLRLFARGLGHRTPFIVDYTRDLTAEKLADGVRETRTACAGVPEELLPSLEAVQVFLEGVGEDREGRGSSEVLAAAREVARPVVESYETAYNASLSLGRSDLGARRMLLDKGRYWEIVLRMLKAQGPHFVAMELNELEYALRSAPQFLSSQSRIDLLVRLHILKHVAGDLALQDLNVEVDDNFAVIEEGSEGADVDSVDEGAVADAVDAPNADDETAGEL